MNQETIHSDRRDSVRASLPIEVEYSANSPTLRARLDDLSETGAFIDTHHALEAGTEMVLRFLLPENGESSPQIYTKARVVWAAPMIGVGVEFIDLDEKSRDRIRFFVASKFFGW